MKYLKTNNSLGKLLEGSKWEENMHLGIRTKLLKKREYYSRVCRVKSCIVSYGAFKETIALDAIITFYFVKNFSGMEQCLMLVIFKQTTVYGFAFGHIIMFI